MEKKQYCSPKVTLLALSTCDVMWVSLGDEKGVYDDYDDLG